MSKDDRIDELEAQVSEQQQIIEGLSDKLVELSGLLPEQERRQFLKAGAGAGALLAAGTVGRASAAPGDDGDTVWGSSNNRDDYYADELDANLVSTETATTTNETFARLTRGAATSSTTAGSFVNLADGESKDIRGEVSSAQFVPDRDGEYLIIFEPEFDGSTVEGDSGRARVRDVTAGSTVGAQRTGFKIEPGRPIAIGIVRGLNAGQTYELQVTNLDNSFKIGTLTTATISRFLAAP